MPKESKPTGSLGKDIFQLLTETAEQEKKRQREKLLAPLDIKDFFPKEA